MSLVNTQITSIMIFSSLIRDQKLAGNVLAVYNFHSKLIIIIHTRLLDRSDIFFILEITTMQKLVVILITYENWKSLLG